MEDLEDSARYGDGWRSSMIEKGAAGIRDQANDFYSLLQKNHNGYLG